MNIVCEMKLLEGRVGEQLEIRWRESGAAFEPYRLGEDDTEDFRRVSAEARRKLRRLSELHRDDAPQEQISQHVREIAKSGRELRDLLFAVGGGASASLGAEVQDWLEAVPLDPAPGLEVSFIDDSRPFLVPWNIVYDGDPHTAEFADSRGADFRRFWGLRYVLTGGKQATPLRRRPLPADTRTLFIVCPRVADRLNWNPAVRFASNQLELVKSVEQVERRLSEELPPIIYWLSHAQSDALYLNGEPVRLDQLRRWLRSGANSTQQRAFRGLSILNACQTGAPGQLSSYLELFQRFNYSGILATEAEVLDSFAVPYGELLLRELFSGQMIGPFSHALRGDPDQLPQSLLYGTYCPPTFRIDVESVSTPATPEPEFKPPRHVKATVLSDTAVQVRPVQMRFSLPEEPYRPLAPFQAEHRALFAGRDLDVDYVVEQLADPGCRVLVLHGASGVGKSSFLLAGVVPWLEEEKLGFLCLDEPDGDWTTRSSLFVRATSDPFAQIARRLQLFCQQPFRFRTPAGKSVEVALMGRLLQAVGADDPEGPINVTQLRDLLAARPDRLTTALNALGETLPFAPVLFVDQAEEIFTLSRDETAIRNRERFLQAVSVAARSLASAKLVLSLRTEYHGRLVDGIRGSSGTGGVRDYLLTDLDSDGILQVLILPTSDAAIDGQSPRQKYNFSYADDIAEQAAKTIASGGHQDGTALLGQVIGAELWRSRESGVIDKTALAKLTKDQQDGGLVEGALRRHTNRQIEAIFADRADRQATWELLDRLSLAQPDGSYTTAHLARTEIARWWNQKSGAKVSFDQFALQAEERRLIRFTDNPTNPDGPQAALVSLGHDALAKLAAARRVERAKKAAVRAIWQRILLVLLSLLALAGGLVYYFSRPYVVRGELSELGVTVTQDDEDGTVMARADGYRDVETKKIGTGKFQERNMVKVGRLLAKLPNLHYIDFDDLATLETFDIQNLKLERLKKLELGGCERLIQVRLPELGNLERLELQNAFMLKEVDGLPKQPNLANINLSGCVQLADYQAVVESLPDSVTTLSLGQWDQYEPTIVRTLVSYKVGATVENLTLSECENLDLDGISALQSLTRLDLSGCQKVSGLGKLASCRKLSWLEVRHCPPALLNKLASVNLGEVRVLDLSDSPALTSAQQLPSSTRICVLDLSGCRQLHDLSGIAARLPNLTILYLDRCVALGQRTDPLVPLNQLQDLVELTLDATTHTQEEEKMELSSLNGLDELRSLRRLDLTECTELSDLTPILGLPLEALDLSGLDPEVHLDALTQSASRKSLTKLAWRGMMSTRENVYRGDPKHPPLSIKLFASFNNLTEIDFGDAIDDYTPDPPHVTDVEAVDSFAKLEKFYMYGWDQRKDFMQTLEEISDDAELITKRRRRSLARERDVLHQCSNPILP